MRRFLILAAAALTVAATPASASAQAPATKPCPPVALNDAVEKMLVTSRN